MSEAGLIYTLMEKTENARCGRVVGWNEESGRVGGSMAGGWKERQERERGYFVELLKVILIVLVLCVCAGLHRLIP